VQGFDSISQSLKDAMRKMQHDSGSGYKESVELFIQNLQNLEMIATAGKKSELKPELCGKIVELSQEIVTFIDPNPHYTRRGGQDFLAKKFKEIYEAAQKAIEALSKLDKLNSGYKLFFVNQRDQTKTLGHRLKSYLQSYARLGISESPATSDSSADEADEVAKNSVHSETPVMQAGRENGVEMPQSSPSMSPGRKSSVTSDSSQDNFDGVFSTRTYSLRQTPPLPKFSQIPDITVFDVKDGHETFYAGLSQGGPSPAGPSPVRQSPVRLGPVGKAPSPFPLMGLSLTSGPTVSSHPTLAPGSGNAALLKSCLEAFDRDESVLSAVESKDIETILTNFIALLALKGLDKTAEFQKLFSLNLGAKLYKILSGLRFKIEIGDPDDVVDMDRFTRFHEILTSILQNETFKVNNKSCTKVFAAELAETLSLCQVHAIVAGVDGDEKVSKDKTPEAEAVDEVRHSSLLSILEYAKDILIKKAHNFPVDYAKQLREMLDYVKTNVASKPGKREHLSIDSLLMIVTKIHEAFDLKEEAFRKPCEKKGCVDEACEAQKRKQQAQSQKQGTQQQKRQKPQPLYSSHEKRDFRMAWEHVVADIKLNRESGVLAILDAISYRFEKLSLADVSRLCAQLTPTRLLHVDTLSKLEKALENEKGLIPFQAHVLQALCKLGMRIVSINTKPTCIVIKSPKGALPAQSRMQDIMPSRFPEIGQIANISEFLLRMRCENTAVIRKMIQVAAIAIINIADNKVVDDVTVHAGDVGIIAHSLALLSEILYYNCEKDKEMEVNTLLQTLHDSIMLFGRTATYDNVSKMMTTHRGFDNFCASIGELAGLANYHGIENTTEGFFGECVRHGKRERKNFEFHPLSLPGRIQRCFLAEYTALTKKEENGRTYSNGLTGNAREYLRSECLIPPFTKDFVLVTRDRIICAEADGAAFHSLTVLYPDNTPPCFDHLDGESWIKKCFLRGQMLSPSQGEADRLTFQINIHEPTFNALGSLVLQRAYLRRLIAEEDCMASEKTSKADVFDIYRQRIREQLSSPCNGGNNVEVSELFQDTFSSLCHCERLEELEYVQTEFAGVQAEFDKKEALEVEDTLEAEETLEEDAAPLTLPFFGVATQPNGVGAGPQGNGNLMFTQLGQQVAFGGAPMALAAGAPVDPNAVNGGMSVSQPKTNNQPQGKR